MAHVSRLSTTRRECVPEICRAFSFNRTAAPSLARVACRQVRVLRGRGSLDGTLSRRPYRASQFPRRYEPVAGARTSAPPGGLLAWSRTAAHATTGVHSTCRDVLSLASARALRGDPRWTCRHAGFRARCGTPGLNPTGSAAPARVTTRNGALQDPLQGALQDALQGASYGVAPHAAKPRVTLRGGAMRHRR